MNMHTSFGECGLFGFRDNISFQLWPNFPWTIVHGSKKIEWIIELAQKIHASRG